MLNKIKAFYCQNKKDDSPLVDQEIVDKFIANPEFPYLVSFGRTGSHWLRTIMELYFEKPALVRMFYLKKAKDFTCLHDHDMSFKTHRNNVLYLYRNPVETIYSQIKYHKLDYNDKTIIKYWTLFYGIHLEKWLINDNWTKKKTIITYEGMKKNMHNEFKKVCEHFGEEYNKDKLEIVLQKVSKKDLKKRTKHDKQVVDLSDKYQNDREIFKQKHLKQITKQLINLNPRLEEWI